MREFFLGQMDYIFFMYGLAFLLVAVSAQAMIPLRGRRLPWAWMAGFGVIHGFNEWLDMVAFAVGDNPVFAGVRLAVMTVSFLCLLEFGRAGTAAQPGRKGPGRLALLPFVALALAGVPAGLPGLAATVRYALALPGGLWAAWTLWRGGCPAKGLRQSPSLMVAGIVMLGYSVATGVVVSPAPFMPAAVLNAATFLEAYGFPIQLVRCVLVCLLAVTFWIHHRGHGKDAEIEMLLSPPHYREHLLVLGLVVLLGCGWAFTQAAGQRIIAAQERALLHVVQGAAAVLGADDFAGLARTPAEMSQPVFLRLRDRCQRLADAIATLRYVYVVQRSRAGLVFVADSDHRGLPGESGPTNRMPGDRYDDAPPALKDVFRTGIPATDGPRAERGGAIASGYAPIRDPRTRHVEAVVGIDADASRWVRLVAVERLGAILITALLIGLTLVYFAMWSRTREEAETQAALRQRARRQQEALVHVATAPAVEGGDIHGASRAISEAAARALSAAYVGVWVGEKTTGKFVNVDLYDAAAASHSEGAIRRMGDYPLYFEALERGQAIVSEDCAADPRLREFTDLVQRRGVASLLAAPVRVAGKLVGAVNVSHSGRPRQWSRDEVQFVMEMADEVSHAVLNAERRAAAEALEKAHRVLEERVRERTAELNRINADLRAEVAERKRAEDERGRLEEQVRQAQKMESLGIMAGGIAHDFNNILMAIFGNLDLARADRSLGAPVRGYLEAADRAAHRAADLSRQMLAYSGRGKFMVQSIDLNELIGEMAQMIEAAIPKKVQLRLCRAENLPAVKVDVIQMRQIVMNLVINAAEAIGDAVGTITLATDVEECGRARLARPWFREPLPEGRYVSLAVEDTGCGMDAETMERVFDPFFTTKFTGRGLGLAAVLGIMGGHRGVIEVRSAVGKGTTFQLLLPMSGEPSTPLSDAAPREELWRGGGTILLVDDEEPIRLLGTKMLEELGFRTLVAGNGREAVEVFRARSTEIDCVLLDLTMPEMDGQEAYDAMRRIRPDVRVLLCSGYTEDEIAERFKGGLPAGIIHKPYDLGELSDRLRIIFEGPGPA